MAEWANSHLYSTTFLRIKTILLIQTHSGSNSLDAHNHLTINNISINLAQEDIKLKDLKAAFPLDGEYHFRFKYKLNGQIVFMDLPSESSGLPLFDGKIFMKATRISWGINHQFAKAVFLRTRVLIGKQTKGIYGDEDVERQKFYSDTEELKRGHSKGVADAGKHRSQSQPQHHDQPHHQYQQAKPSGFSNVHKTEKTSFNSFCRTIMTC